ncbi:MAG: hypothetical protein WA118_06625 [Carboxydocellales bacterium]
MISAADSQYYLPLYPRLQPVSRHDSVSLVVSAVEFKQRFTLGTVEKMLLDSAHDAEAIYHLMAHQNIEPFIDLNDRSKKNTKTSSDIQISPNGIPICSIGVEMKPNVHDNLQDRLQAGIRAASLHENVVRSHLWHYNLPAPGCLVCSSEGELS